MIAEGVDVTPDGEIDLARFAWKPASMVSESYVKSAMGAV